ncbi:ABC transporter permease subunit (plasmid) [Rhizobium leguminosarum]
MEFKSIPHEFHIQFISGLLNTTSVFFLSALLGTIVGMTIAIMIVSQDARGSNIAVAYTNTVRGVPELLIILIAYFGGTAALSALAGQYVEINAFAAGVIALTLVFGGYAAEIFRGAINAVPVGQVEAAKSLGLAPWQSWVFVIIPQMVPPYPSEQDRGILGAARGNVGSWRSMRTRSMMPFWRCYGLRCIMSVGPGRVSTGQRRIGFTRRA